MSREPRNPPPTTSSFEPAKRGISGALERGRLRLLEWEQSGTLISADQFAGLAGVPVTALPEAEARHELFSLTVDGRTLYPAELLKLEPEVATVVCYALGDLDGASKLVFLLRGHGALSGKTVADAVSQGRLDQVIALAQAFSRDTTS